MHSLNYYFPPFHLFLIVETGSSHKSSASGAPRGSFGEYETCSCSLFVVLLHDGVGYAIGWVTSFSGESSHDDSIAEGEISELYVICPVDIHLFVEISIMTAE